MESLKNKLIKEEAERLFYIAAPYKNSSSYVQDLKNRSYIKQDPVEKEIEEAGYILGRVHGYDDNSSYTKTGKELKTIKKAFDYLKKQRKETI